MIYDVNVSIEEIPCPEAAVAGCSVLFIGGTLAGEM